MPKRKITREPSAEESDLSSPPADLFGSGQAEAGADVLAEEPQPVTKRRGRQARPVAANTSATASDNHIVIAPAQKRKRGQKSEAKVSVAAATLDAAPDEKTLPKTARKRQRVVKDEEQELDEKSGVAGKSFKQKRKTKAEKEAELVDMPLAARTAGHKLYIGAHVSAAGGVHQSILNSVHIGANAFAIFLKSQRKWANPPLLDDHCNTFHKYCKDHLYSQSRHVVPHGSYLVNLAHTDKVRTAQAYDAFIDDLRRCERLGIALYNFHPGNVQCGDRQKAIAHLAANINRAHGETSTVVTLLENMAAGGNVLGTTFEDLRDIIALVTDKKRVGVCLDTCHAFAAGYDLRTPQAFKETMEQFEDVVGVQHLRAMHLNDSKAPFAAHRDLHANIGTGFLGLRAFHNVVNEPRFAGLPLVLETPIEVRDQDGNLVKDEKGKEKEDKGIWAREIKLLESLVGMDAECDDFVKLEAQLQRQGEPERKRLMEQADRKKEKAKKKISGPKNKVKGKKGLIVDGESSLSEFEEGSDGE